jgi:hypothetical protein
MVTGNSCAVARPLDLADRDPAQAVGTTDRVPDWSSVAAGGPDDRRK